MEDTRGAWGDAKTLALRRIHAYTRAERRGLFSAMYVVVPRAGASPGPPGRSSKQVNGGALQSLQSVQSAPNCSRPARQRAGRRAPLTHLHIMYMGRVTGHREHAQRQWSAEATGGTE
jgi:hypothetical protein